MNKIFSLESTVVGGNIEQQIYSKTLIKWYRIRRVALMNKYKKNRLSKISYGTLWVETGKDKEPFQLGSSKPANLNQCMPNRPFRAAKHSIELYLQLVTVGVIVSLLN